MSHKPLHQQPTVSQPPDTREPTVEYENRITDASIVQMANEAAAAHGFDRLEDVPADQLTSNDKALLRALGRYSLTMVHATPTSSGQGSSGTSDLDRDASKPLVWRKVRDPSVWRWWRP